MSVEAIRVVIRPVFARGRFRPGTQPAPTGRDIVGLSFERGLLQEQLGEPSSFGNRQRFCVREEAFKLRHGSMLAASGADSKETLADRPWPSPASGVLDREELAIPPHGEALGLGETEGHGPGPAKGITARRVCASRELAAAL